MADYEEKRRAEDRRFRREVARQTQRKERARQEKNWTVWRGLSTMGMVGWTVALPTLLGVLLGLWLDATWPGPVPWRFVLMLAGLGLGCLGAWLWVAREVDTMLRHREKPGDEHE